VNLLADDLIFDLQPLKVEQTEIATVRILKEETAGIEMIHLLHFLD
jgi:hypothetical protein